MGYDIPDKDRLDLDIQYRESETQGKKKVVSKGLQGRRKNTEDDRKRGCPVRNPLPLGLRRMSVRAVGVTRTYKGSKDEKV